MNTTTLDQAEMLCIVTPEKAINYQWANATKDANLASICIAVPYSVVRVKKYQKLKKSLS